MRKVTTINFTYETNGTEEYKPTDLISILIDKTDGAVTNYSMNTTVLKDDM